MTPGHNHDPRLVAALGPVARGYLSRHIDPAAAFIAAEEGLFSKQARARARNAQRSLGSSWPDRLPAEALIDPNEMRETQHSCGLHALSPDEVIEAVEAAAAALAAPDAPRRLAQASLREIDTAQLAAAAGLTQRRARQIKALRVAIAAVQLPLFGDEGGDHE